MIVFNFAFNILWDAININLEGKELKNKSEVLELEFKNNKKLNNLKEIMTALEKINIHTAFSNDIEISNKKIKNEFSITKVTSVYAISNSNLFDYNISWGRNISTDDILKGNKVAIISYDYEDLIYIKNNTKFIDISNETYEVIGIIKNIMGQSFYHSNIFIPYTAYPPSWNNNISIDKDFATGLISSNNIIKDIKNFDTSKYDISNYNIRSLNIKSVKDNLTFLKTDLRNFIIIGIASLLNIILFSFYWINCRKKKISIYKAVGYSNIDIYKELLIEILKLCSISLIATNLLYYILAPYIRKKVLLLSTNWSPGMLVLDLLLIVIISVIILFMSSFVIKSKNINKNIDKIIKLSNNKIIKIFIVFQIFIMTVNFINLFEVINYYNVRINKINELEQGKSLFFTNSFSVPNDNNKLKEIKIEDITNKLKLNNIEVISYLYDTEPLKDKVKIDLNPENLQTLESLKEALPEKSDLLEKSVPILYINKTNLENKIISGKYNLSNKQNNNYIEVILGNKYSKKYKVNDQIKTESGKIYLVKGFLDKQLFYKDIDSSLPIDDLINIDDTIVIPFNNIRDIMHMSSNYTDYEYLKYRLLKNSIYKASSTLGENYLKELMKDNKLSLISKQYTIEDFNLGYMSDILYKAILTSIIFVISLIGVISFVLIMIFDNIKSFSIKFSLGYTKNNIFKEMILKILNLFLSANIITLIIISLDKYKDITYIVLKFMIISFITILIPTLIIIYNNLNKFKPKDLLKGE